MRSQVLTLTALAAVRRRRRLKQMATQGMLLRLQTEASSAPLGFNFSHSVYCVAAYAVLILYLLETRESVVF